MEEAIVEELSAVQLKDSITTYNSVVALAFKSCVHGFRDSKLTEKEKRCIAVTTEKFLRHSQRAAARFAEHQSRIQAANMAQASAIPKPSDETR